jgi:glycosyltransferase involved in cell wall biosynthesis
MNILQLSTLDNKGGAAMVAWGLMNGLEENGIKSNMIVRHKMSTSDKVMGLKFHPIRQRLGENLSDDVDFGHYAKILVSDFYKQADCVHCHNINGPFVNLNLLAKMSRAKLVVWTLHDMWAFTGHCSHSFDCEKYLTGCGGCPYLDTPPRLDRDTTAYLWWRKKNIYRNCNIQLVAPSEWLKKKLENSILADKPVELIYNGIDTTLFKPMDKDRLRKKLGLSLDKKIICFIANGGKDNFWKGGDIMGKALEMNKDDNVVFLNIGGRESGRENGVINTGYIKDKNILAQYYAASDVFLFSSIAENFPLVTLEAMACGLPVVSCDVGGVKEVLDHHKNGYLAKYKDAVDLGAGLGKILRLSPDELEEISKRNSGKIDKEYSLKLMVENYRKLYERLL